MSLAAKNNLNRGWQCPYCQHFATIRDDDLFKREEKLYIYPDGDLSYILTAITCPNSNCRKLILHLMIRDDTPVPPIPQVTSVRQAQFSPGLLADIKEQRERPRMTYGWQLLPTSKAKIFPTFVPQSIRDDYEESCKIVDLSPKASATLARRCLQTIIRDFWGVKNKANLSEEIDALLQRTDLSASLISAFHDLRSIGNIGAHMEKDVNLIIEVDAEEAEMLIKFIESLIELTYIEKHNHEELLKKIKNISSDKQEKKKKNK